MQTARRLSPWQCLAAFAMLAYALVPALAAAQAPAGGKVPAAGQAMKEVLGVGDTVRITTYRYPDLTTETRVSEDGKVNVPLVGPLRVQGMTPDQAANLIAERMKSGKYILNPQIDVAVIEARSRQVSVLGFVNRPGRYILDGSAAKLTDVLAMAGGLVPAASDTAIITRNREGKGESLNIDLAAIIQRGEAAKDIQVVSGDSVFVPKANVVYVHGEVMRGGSYRLEPGMTVTQAISLAGGLTPRGSESRIKVRRREADGSWKEKSAKPQDPVSPNDEIHVRESLF